MSLRLIKVSRNTLHCSGLLFALCIFTQTAWCQPSLYGFQSEISASALPPDSQPREYYTIDERTTGSVLANNHSFTSPLQVMQETAFAAKATLRVTLPSGIHLTQWMNHRTAPPVPAVKYDRRMHFGSWINDPNDQTCYNTRAKVLIRDSKTQVTYKPNNKCVVDTGTWNDPYTGQKFYSTKDIQIDHVVPLKHAYQSGAWKWDYRTRCLYGNFMANSYHLLSVNGHENMSKGDKSPAKYIPPNPRITCTYLQAWLLIKLTWGLIILPEEAIAIHNAIEKNNCDQSQFAMARTELNRLRKSMLENPDICNRPPAASAALNSTASF